MVLSGNSRHPRAEAYAPTQDESQEVNPFKKKSKQLEELPSDIVLKQPLAILGERAVVERSVLNTHVEELCLGFRPGFQVTTFGPI